LETPFEQLPQESLLDALTEYYNKYRNYLEISFNPEEFADSQATLFAILAELNKRYGLRQDPMIREFSTDRQSS